MKRTLIMLLVAAIMLLTACGAQGLDVSKLEKSEYNAALQSRDVAMTMEETSVAADTETLALHFASSSDNEYTFGMEPRLEIESGGEWYIVPTLEGAAWIEIAYVLPPGEGSDMEFPLKTFYGKLAAGHYRIVKPLYSEAGNTFVIAELTVE